MALTLLRNNANYLVLERVTDYLSGEITDMAGTITIFDQRDDTILIGCDAMPITYATNSEGRHVYYVAIPQTVQITDGTKYRALFISSNYGVEAEMILTGRRRVLT